VPQSGAAGENVAMQNMSINITGQFIFGLVCFCSSYLSTKRYVCHLLIKQRRIETQYKTIINIICRLC